MIHLYSSRIGDGIFFVDFVGRLVVGVGGCDFYLWGMALYSIWGVYGL
jgi:hypothetical protein